MFTCQHEIKQKLEEWADSENRTISNLVETIVEQAIASRDKQKEDK